MLLPYYSASVDDVRQFAQIDELHAAATAPVLPPTTKRGVDSSTHGVDWVEGTIHNAGGQCCTDLIGVPWEEGFVQAHGMRHYPKCWRRGYATVGFGGDDHNGSHLRLPGSALRELESECDLEPVALARKSAPAGFVPSRVDAFIDCRDGSITPESIREKFRSGECVTHASSGRMVENDERGCPDSRGATYYIGKRGSNRVLRVYDKAQEQCPDHLRGAEREQWLRECGPWVRIELEMRDEQAQRFWRDLAEKGFGEGLIASYINAFVEFKEKEAKGAHNGSRAPMWTAWAKLLGSVEKVRPASGVKSRSLADMKRWLEHQYGPTIATIYAAEEGCLQFFKDVAIRSLSRVSLKQQMAIQELDITKETWAA